MIWLRETSYCAADVEVLVGRMGSPAIQVEVKDREFLPGGLIAEFWIRSAISVSCRPRKSPNDEQRFISSSVIDFCGHDATAAL